MSQIRTIQARLSAYRGFRSHIGGEIKALRLSLGLSQSEFARKLKSSNIHICRIETGVSLPSCQFLSRIVTTFKEEENGHA